MKRKLVKQGAATLMISLPAKWVQHHHLNKGSEINIEQVEDSLMISSSTIDIKKEASIELSDSTESSIRTLITNTYRKGYDKIKVKFSNEKQFKILEDVIKTRLIGFEIIKKSQHDCSVENITEPSPDQFETLIRKIFYNIQDLFEITKARLTNPISFEDIEAIEERIQKYDNFCRRVITKKGIHNQNSELLWTFLTLLIHAQREIYIMNIAINSKIPISEKTTALLEEARKLFELIQKAYIDKNPASINQVHSLEKELIYKKSYPLLERIKGKEAIFIYHIASSIRQFYLSTSPLLGLILS